jgi:hypothetical protein
MTLNIAVFAPIPSASVIIATHVNQGYLMSIRRLYRTSCHSVVVLSPLIQTASAGRTLTFQRKHADRQAAHLERFVGDDSRPAQI